MDDEKAKEGIKNVIEGLARAFSNEEKEKAKKFFLGKEDVCVKIFEDLKNANIDLFFLNKYTHEELKCACELIEPIDANKRGLFQAIVLNYLVFESTFENIIKNVEGMPCCVDKSSFLMRSVFKHMLGVKEYNNPQEEYWHPKSVFGDWEFVEEILNTVFAVIHGDYKTYIKVMRKYNIEG